MIFQGDCIIAVQVAGPWRGRWPRVRAIPNDLRALAARIIQRCVTLRGVGGFGTLGFANLANSVLNGQTYINSREQDWSYAVAFLTIDVKRIGTPNLKPGDTDPKIPRALAAATQEMSRFYRSFYLSPSQIWMYQAENMQRGGDAVWYQKFSTGLNEMSYDCDAGLGSPSISDCSQIEWNQLGSNHPPSDTLAVGPGITTILHSNTCYLAISAAVSLVLTWAQIRTAVSTLMNVCLRAPNLAAQEGKVFYAAPQQISRRTMGKRQDTALTGLNALPPHANITIFEQHQAWMNPAAELKSCTWEAVTKGIPVSTCPNP